MRDPLSATTTVLPEVQPVNAFPLIVIVGLLLRDLLAAEVALLDHADFAVVRLEGLGAH